MEALSELSLYAVIICIFDEMFSLISRSLNEGGAALGGLMDGNTNCLRQGIGKEYEKAGELVPRP